MRQIKTPLKNTLGATIHLFHKIQNYNILDFLNQEYKIKKGLDIKPKTNSNTFISATDIANFTYCPANFAIAKTFDLLKIEAAYIGTDFHEERRLLNYLSNEKIANKDNIALNKSKDTFINSDNEIFFNELIDAKLIYNGHGSESEKKYFKSLKGNFAGQPDYIFENLNKQYYVVEEKFQFQGVNVTTEKTKSFHSNHINQLISYLHGIKDYELNYGYLVYWKFDFDWGHPFVHTCNVLKVVKNDETRKRIISVYLNLRNLINNKVDKFDITNRNPNKCANCVSNLLCGHKTGKFTTLKYPYSIEYLKTEFVEFPNELKKDNSLPELNSEAQE